MASIGHCQLAIREMLVDGNWRSAVDDGDDTHWAASRGQLALHIYMFTYIHIYLADYRQVERVARTALHARRDTQTHNPHTPYNSSDSGSCSNRLHQEKMR